VSVEQVHRLSPRRSGYWRALGVNSKRIEQMMAANCMARTVAVALTSLFAGSTDERRVLSRQGAAS
jgi:hypothetical protein